MLRSPRTSIPLAGMHINVQWEVQCASGSLGMRWFMAKVLRCSPLGNNQGNVLATGTLAYIPTVGFASNPICAVNFLTNGRVSIMPQGAHDVPIPCLWQPVQAREEEPRDIYATEDGEIPIADRLATLESSSYEFERTVRDAIGKIRALETAIHRTVPSSTASDHARVQSVLRFKIVHALQKPTGKGSRKLKRNSSPEILLNLSFGGIERSFVATQFPMAFSDFKAFHMSTKNAEAQLPSSEKTIFTPSDRLYQLEPSPKYDYTASFRDYGSFCSSIALNHPDTRKQLLFRTKGSPRVLGCFLRNRSQSNGPILILPATSGSISLLSSPEFLEMEGSTSSICLLLEDSTYKDVEGSFRFPFVPTCIEKRTISVTTPDDEYFPYNTFSISWKSHAPLSKSLRSDPALSNNTIGTVRISVPILTFTTPSMSTTIISFMKDPVVSKLAKCSV